MILFLIIPYMEDFTLVLKVVIGLLGDVFCVGGDL